MCLPVSAAGPDQWVTSVDASSGMVFWGRAADTAPSILPGQSLDGFQLAFTREASCCYELHFVGLYPEPLGVEDVCFKCDRPVPVIPRTWGAVKALYR